MDQAEWLTTKKKKKLDPVLHIPTPQKTLAFCASSETCAVICTVTLQKLCLHRNNMLQIGVPFQNSETKCRNPAYSNVNLRRNVYVCTTRWTHVFCRTSKEISSSSDLAANVKVNTAPTSQARFDHSGHSLDQEVAVKAKVHGADLLQVVLQIRRVVLELPEVFPHALQGDHVDTAAKEHIRMVAEVSSQHGHGAPSAQCALQRSGILVHMVAVETRQHSTLQFRWPMLPSITFCIKCCNGSSLTYNMATSCRQPYESKRAMRVSFRRMILPRTVCHPRTALVQTATDLVASHTGGIQHMPKNSDNIPCVLAIKEVLMENRHDAGVVSLDAVLAHVLAGIQHIKRVVEGL